MIEVNNNYNFMNILASPITRRVDAMKILHGCCIALMKDIPDDSVDIILTDPPYYSTALGFDQAPRIDFKAWLMECRRILKPSGVLVSFADFNLLAELRGHKVFKTSYELVWHKSQATGFLDANLRPLRQHEFVGVFVDGLKKSTYNPQKTKGNAYVRHRGERRRYRHYAGARRSLNTVSDGDRFPVSVQRFSRDPVRKQHPTQKPIALCEWLINTYSNAGDTVFDGFMGSGSSGVAAKNLNRRFIGIEKDAAYFDMAKNNVQQAISNKGR